MPCLGGVAHELHEFARKEIGSWFSLASPIKTTAGFWIKIELVFPTIEKRWVPLFVIVTNATMFMAK